MRSESAEPAIAREFAVICCIAVSSWPTTAESCAISVSIARACVSISPIEPRVESAASSQRVP